MLSLANNVLVDKNAGFRFAASQVLPSRYDMVSTIIVSWSTQAPQVASPSVAWYDLPENDPASLTSFHQNCYIWTSSELKMALGEAQSSSWMEVVLSIRCIPRVFQACTISALDEKAQVSDSWKI